MKSDLPNRKRPAHMPPLERHNQPIVLFVTIGTQPRREVFANSVFDEAFKLACTDADAWSVGRFIIMPDHLHLFCEPARWPRVGIKRWSSYLKERITKRLNASVKSELDCYALPDGNEQTDSSWQWQSDCWDTQIRSRQHYEEKWGYVRENPVRKGLAIQPDDWPWQGDLNVLCW